MTTIKSPHVYRVVQVPPDPHQRMFLPDLKVGMLLWLNGNRRSSLGSYIGRFSPVYEHRGYYMPRNGVFEMLMEYVEPAV
jgi:hypothetical protein